MVSDSSSRASQEQDQWGLSSQGTTDTDSTKEELDWFIQGHHLAPNRDKLHWLVVQGLRQLDVGVRSQLHVILNPVEKESLGVGWGASHLGVSSEEKMAFSKTPLVPGAWGWDSLCANADGVSTGACKVAVERRPQGWGVLSSISGKSGNREAKC